MAVVYVEKLNMKRLERAITRVLFLVVILVTITDVDASCFNPPTALASDRIEEIRAAGHLDMSWSFGEKSESHFRFITSENEVYLELLKQLIKKNIWYGFNDLNAF